MPSFWRVALPGEQSNSGSRQYIYRFPDLDSCTVFWSNPESRKKTLPGPEQWVLTANLLDHLGDWTPITLMIFFNQGMVLLGSNHFLSKPIASVHD